MTAPGNIDLKEKSDQTRSRFPHAAVQYTNALLDILRLRFDAEIAAMAKDSTGHERSYIQSGPQSFQMFIEEDQFIGSGWSMCQQSFSKRPYRWMKRVGTILIPVGQTTGVPVILSGPKLVKRRFLKRTSIFIDGFEVKGKFRRKAMRGWEFSGQLPRLSKAGRKYHILKIRSQTAGRCRSAPDGRASIALSEIRIG